MKFTVKIEQTLTGYVEIETNSPEEALEIAETRYNREENCRIWMILVH